MEVFDRPEVERRLGMWRKASLPLHKIRIFGCLTECLHTTIARFTSASIITSLFFHFWLQWNLPGSTWSWAGEGFQSHDPCSRSAKQI